MAKAKKGTKENPITTDDLANIAEAVLKNKRPYKITEAVIKDDFCNYKFEMTEGKGPYDIHKVDGKGIIVDDMREVFRRFRVHLASIYGAYRLNGVEVDDIDNHHTDDITAEFHVEGFKIKGSEDNESIILIGSKYIQELGGRMALETPKIDISSFSSYKWYNELKDLADKAREEVALYKEGKYIVPDADEEEETVSKKDGTRRKKPKQLSIEASESISETEQEEATEEIDSDDDFEAGRL